MKTAIAAVVVLAALSTGSRAAPLGVMWKSAAGCPDPERHQPFESKRGLLWTDHGTLVRWEPATGAALPPVKIKGKSPWVVAATPDLVVVQDPAEITALDPTLHLKWRHPAGADAAVAVAGADIVFLAPAAHGKRSVELLDGATGKPKWTASIANPAGYIAFLVATTAQVVIGSTPNGGKTPSTLVALALADGAAKWTAKTTTSIAFAAIAGVRTIGEVVAVSTEDALVLVGADGKATSLALPRLSLKRVVGDRLYADDYRVFAIDVPARKQAWVSTLGGSSTFVAATADSVYAVGGNETLVELDAKSGKSVSTFAVGGQQLFGFAAAPHVIACDKKSTVALDSSVADQPVESATITGIVACDACDGATVHAGDITATADAKGKFTLKATARGILAVTVEIGKATLPVGTVHLDGSHTYQLGTVKVDEPVDGD